MVNQFGEIACFTINSRKLEQMKDFYVNRLGFTILKEEPRDFVMIKSGSLSVCIDRIEEEQKPESNIQIFFKSEDMNETFKLLKSKGINAQIKERKGEKFLSTVDPGGNELLFVNSL